MSALRAALHYLILVGIPFLGVLAVMKIGSGLTPPPSIRGKWVLDAELHANQKTACSERLSGFREPNITISQSGTFLDVSLPNPRKDVLAGQLLGSASFIAEAPPALFGEDVFGLLRVTGAIATEGGSRVIRGIIAMPRRVDCVPVPYVARLAPTIVQPK